MKKYDSIDLLRQKTLRDFFSRDLITWVNRSSISVHIKLKNSTKAPKIFYSSISCIDILNIFYSINFQGNLLLN